MSDSWNEKQNTCFDESEILAEIKRPCDLMILDETGSTNEIAKTAGLGNAPLLIIADSQTSGKGRLGRTFESPAGTGLYMTLALRPDFDMEKSLFVTMMAGVAAVRAIRKVAGAETGIKWVNDVFLNGKKVSGILVEAVPGEDPEKAERLVIGIGINCFSGSFPDDIKDIAGPVSDEHGSFSRSMLAGAVTRELLDLIDGIGDPVRHASFMDEYRGLCFITGREILVHRTYNDDGVPAKAVAVVDDGGLTVEYLSDAGPSAGHPGGIEKGLRETLHTGEVSVSLSLLP